MIMYYNLIIKSCFALSVYVFHESHYFRKSHHFWVILHVYDCLFAELKILEGATSEGTTSDLVKKL